MQYCKQCKKTVGTTGFCTVCGTSVYVVNNEQFEIYIDNHKSNVVYDVPKKQVVNNLPKKSIDGGIKSEVWQKELDELEKFSFHNKRYKCPVCGKRFKTFIVLKNHRKYLKHNQNKYPEYIKSDGKVTLQKPSSIAKCTIKDSVIGGVESTEKIWKSFEEHSRDIRSVSLRKRFKEIHDIGKSLKKEKVQCFSCKNGFSFIIRGVEVGNIILNSTGFTLTLMMNFKKPGKMIVKQKKNKYMFNKLNLNPISNSNIKERLIEQSNILLALRSRNIKVHMDKWLHCLLIEQMEADGLPELGLDFLYYETPVGKVKLNQRFGREHVDIVARERSSGAFIVVVVKMEDFDLGAAIIQGTSYLDWIRKNQTHLAPRVKQLGWDVDLDNVKLYVIAPGSRTPSVDNDARVVLVNWDWYVDERIKIIN